MFAARQAPADGYTLLLGTTSTLAINPHLYASMGYDPLNDLQPVTLTHQMPNVLLVHPGTPFKTIADVVNAAKAKPAGLAYGSAGNGNTMHLAGELFQARSGAKLMHVPCNGGAPALNDVMAGQIPMMFNYLPAIVEYLNKEMRAVLESDAFRAPLEAQGFEVLSSTPKAFETLLRQDHAQMGELIRVNKIE